MSLFELLGNEVFLEIVHNWISLVDVGRIDQALVGMLIRHQFLDLFKEIFF